MGGPQAAATMKASIPKRLLTLRDKDKDKEKEKHGSHHRNKSSEAHRVCLATNFAHDHLAMPTRTNRP